jgi:hypothetical protein
MPYKVALEYWTKFGPENGVRCYWLIAALFDQSPAVIPARASVALFSVTLSIK